MEQQLLFGVCYSSFKEFEDVLKRYSKNNSVNFKITTCELLENNQQARKQYNRGLKYISCKYECELTPNGCIAYIKLKAVNRKFIGVIDSELRHKHPYGPNAATIQQTCSDLEFHLANLFENQQIKKIRSLNYTLKKWSEEEKISVASKSDPNYFFTRHPCMIMQAVTDFGYFVSRLPVERQLQKIFELKYLLEKWAIEDENPPDRK